MKKILTVLLSFFMVATLGIVNVSAKENVLGMLNITPTSSKIIYNGSSQTLFQIECAKESCDYKYALSTDSSNTATVDWEAGLGKYVNASKTQPGTYYLHLLKDEKHYVYNEDGVSGVTIYGKTKITINAPTATFDNYYLVTAESDDVALPFTVTSDPKVNTQWNDAKVTFLNASSSYTEGIAFDKTNGNLTIDADNVKLSNGTYKVELSATSTDSLYEGSGDTTIYVAKLDSNDFKINLNSYYLDDNGDVFYGLTAQQIIDKIVSVTNGNNTIAPVEGKTTISSAEVQKLVNGDYVRVLDDNVLLVNDNDNYYRIKLTITQSYDGGSYTYDVIDNFKVVRNYASATITPSEGLVYNGDYQVLATASDVIPTGDGTSTTGATVKFKVSNREGDPETVYESLNEMEVDEPTRKNAGTYYVYYHIDHGTNDNYQDVYGMVTVTIDKAPLTVMGLDDKTIPYDGERHEPDFDVDGFIKSEEPFDLKVFNPTDKDHRYKDAGDWTVTVKIPYSVEEGKADPSNYKLVDSEGKEVSSLSATLTIEKATAKVVAATSIYYKNNKGTATIKSNGLSGDFVALRIKKADGTWETVDENNYTVSKNGPTIIVLSEEYLQSKADGKETFEIGKDYEFALAFNPNNYTTDLATTTLQVRKYTAPSSDSSSSSSSSSSTTAAKKVVNTSAN